MATEAPTEVTTTETPGIPVTGNVNPASLSEELTFPVLSQDGQQIGTVSDMVLDLDNTNVAYIAVDTRGFGDVGDKQILIPWDLVKLENGTGTGTSTDLATATADTGTGGTGLATDTPSAGTGGTGLATATAGTGTGGNTGGQQNAFILQTDLDTFSNAPDFDLSTLPAMGQSASDWDLDIRNYWQNGGGGTGTGVATATSGPGIGTDLATATPGTGTSGTGLATATTDTSTGGTGLATATTTTGSDGTGTGSMAATIEDMIIATDTGAIQYIVLNTNAGTQQLIPVPLSIFQWDNTAQAFALNIDSTMLQSAPTLENGQIPDTTTSGWNSQFDTFWQNNGTGGSGTGLGNGQATATATP